MAAPGGWYSDPFTDSAPGTERWWDGQQWTGHTRLAAPPILILPISGSSRNASPDGGWPQFAAGWHRSQLSWNPLIRIAWWVLLLPLAVFCWAASLQGAVGRLAGFGLAGFIVLIGLASTVGADESDETSRQLNLDVGSEAPALTVSEPNEAPASEPPVEPTPPSPPPPVLRPVDQVGTGGLPPNPGQFYPERIGIEPNDHEGTLGSDGGAAYGGWNMYIDNAVVMDGRLTIEGRAFNREDSAQSFNVFDWGLQQPSGEINGTLIMPTDGSGSAASGGTAPFTLAFDVRDRVPGEVVYLIHENTFSFDDARGVWGLVIP